MTYIGLGSLCFLLFIIYDLNQIHKNYKAVRPLFAAGCITLCVLTVIVSVTACESDYQVSLPAVAVFFLLAGVQLFLLIYTLFFAVPFQEAYVAGSKQKICTTGVYALCRHPGALFLAGFYLFLSLGLGKPFLLLTGTAYTGMNLLYILFQDIYSFPRLFEGYDAYRKNTPFLIPNAASLKKCISSLKTYKMEKTADKGGHEG
ncbi:methyltransferase family protein [Clostridium transplantifaecale]|uniref:methyltransferase family protein n=1 Tax=Clostridium transplantifaecale TaxID=2479838 RepID=UPI000F635E86|nr:hypothetical protein [Clostridium transplantifaecale]